MDNKELVEKVTQVITDRAHGIELLNKIKDIITELGISENMTSLEQIEKISEYLKNRIRFRKEYLDIDEGLKEDEMIYRTAYAALVRHEAVCAGTVEAVRILLNMFNINSYTILAQLPNNSKDALHYAVAVEYVENGAKRYKVVDIERQILCEKKGINFEKYLERCIYTIPKENFYENKISNNGTGPRATQYLENEDVPRIKGTSNIVLLINEMNNSKKKDKKIVEATENRS